jgi:ADP-ribose pyrophosphatase
VPGDHDNGTDEPGGPAARAPEGWRFLESVAEYDTGWYTGGYDRLEQPDGREKNYYWAALPPAVVVTARDGDELVMIRQYRPAIRRYCLEHVAGIVEQADVDGGFDQMEGVPEAAYETAAGRELREEAGFDPGETRLLAEMWCSTGVLRHRRGHVFATELDPAERRLDTNEFIDVTRVPVEAAFEHATAAPANDATLEGVLLAEREGLLDR